MSDYAARIRAARAYKGLTQEQLARRLGIDVQTVKRREAGTQHPKRGELLAIAAITGVPAEFMEHGFGEIDRDDLSERLDRIEALLRAGEAGTAGPSNADPLEGAARAWDDEPPAAAGEDQPSAASR